MTIPTANNNSGYIWTKEQLLNLSAAKKGFKHSEEAKRKMSLACLGRKKSKEHVEKIARTKRGKKHSEEDRKKIALHPRKFDKWPHEKGSCCRCIECKFKKNEMLKVRRAKSKSI